MLERLKRLFGLDAAHVWEYGVAGNDERIARRHKMLGNVQFVLWKAGEQGHSEDYWHNFDRSWWPTFKSTAQPSPRG